MKEIFSQKINKSIPTPLYYQLKQIIRDAIDSGMLNPGDAIPTEKKFMELYEISRTTVRQAILDLVSEGYLHREKSKGTFVTKPPVTMMFMESLRWFSNYLARKGIPHYSKVIEKKVIPASSAVANFLRISKSNLVFYLKRIRYVNDRPFIIDRHFVPYSFCLGIEEKEFQSLSLYDTLENQYGISLHHGWREFEPVMPTKEEVDLLEINANTPLLKVESLICNEQDIPLNYFILRMLGKFTVDILNNEELKIGES
ncbi:MAG TPA: GntR family transcriptional regulator [Anaerolineae bacterium]|nr:GntR family transcriptional regulator [Anaerolineae bacterium]